MNERVIIAVCILFALGALCVMRHSSQPGDKLHYTTEAARELKDYCEGPVFEIQAIEDEISAESSEVNNLEGTGLEKVQTLCEVVLPLYEKEQAIVDEQDVRYNSLLKKIHDRKVEALALFIEGYRALARAVEEEDKDERVTLLKEGNSKISQAREMNLRFMAEIKSVAATYKFELPASLNP